MAGKSRRPPLVLTPEEVQHLKRLRRSRKAPAREVQRAEILWRYHGGETIAEIMRAVKMTRKSVAKWIERALAMGVEAALKDAYHRPYEPRISEEAKAWVVHLACCKPKDLGYAAELWTRSALARHVRQHAVEAGYPALAQAAKATVHRILAAQPLHPEKVKCYLQRRDPDFESKMRQVLLVYREVALQTSPALGTAGSPPWPGAGPAGRRGHRSMGPHPQPAGFAGTLWRPEPRRFQKPSHRSREFILLQLDKPTPHPIDPGQSFLPHFQGDEGLFGRVRTGAYADPRVLAEHCGDAMGAHF